MASELNLLQSLYEAVQWPRITVGDIETLSHEIKRVRSYGAGFDIISKYIVDAFDRSPDEAFYEAFVLGAHFKRISFKAELPIEVFPFQALAYIEKRRRVYFSFSGGLKGFSLNKNTEFVKILDDVIAKALLRLVENKEHGGSSKLARFVAERQSLPRKGGGKLTDKNPRRIVMHPRRFQNTQNLEVYLGTNEARKFIDDNLASFVR